MPMVLMKEMKLMMLTTMHTMLKMRRKTKRKEAHNHLQEGRTETSILEAFVTRISLRELIRATSNFSEENIIRLGKMGTMYKGVLLNGSLLAVKRFRNFQHFEKQFIYEVRTLGRLRHNNLVPLFGFCAEEEERLLVYKYMASGNLCEWLHPLEADSKFLEWPLRVRIGIGLARGLAWLHHTCKPRVIHGNISSNCILLDQKFEPKLSNFGTSMILKSNDSNSHIGEAHLSESLLNISKEDVYCFGIVLLEMVTGEKPNQVSDASDNFSGTLVEWITHLWDASRPYNAIDKLLAAQGFDGEIVQFLKVAYNCVKSSPNERPSMLEVYRILSAIGETYRIANDSEILTGNESGIGNHRNENTRDEIIEVIK
ncbi:hypothetical protein L1049_017137 [Liquidambar formosana]|uniref:Protein kinase domain-containing protein n=1 Tax=Liquidambar formosana TaxID=63359 RepID=A0AAP0S2F6_LIQFO